MVHWVWEDPLDRMKYEYVNILSFYANEENYKAQILVLPLMSFVTLSNLLNHTMSSYTQLQNEDNTGN